jgi:quercetin dioxygenase-like cupin family protein
LVTYLNLIPKQRCSWHKHKHLFNQFFVVEGELGVKTDKGYTSILKQGENFTVEPGVKHEFQTYDQPAKVIEIAFVKRLGEDIQRDALGGPLEE